MSKPTTNNPQISTQKDKNVAQGFIIFIVAVAAIGAITNNSTPAADPVVYGKESSLQDLSDNTLNNRMRFIKTNEGVEINDERNKPKEEEEKKEEPKKEEPKKEEPKPEEKKQESPKEEAKPEPAPTKSSQRETRTEWINRVTNLQFPKQLPETRLSVEVADAMYTAAEEYDIKPEYLLTIGLSENALSPEGIGDGGMSFGIYQIYMTVHKSTDLNPSIMDCAKDFLCSSRWTARRVKNMYFAGYSEDSWILALSKHHGQVRCPKSYCASVNELVGESWYAAKIEMNGIAVGLSY